MFALLFLLITLMVQTGVSGDKCPPKWFEYGKQCIRYKNMPKNHADAQAECKKMGANLVSVHSAEDYKRLQNFIKHVPNADGPAWIGAVDLNKNNKWTWVDGSKFDFSSWCAGQPKGKGIQNCVQIIFSGKKCWDHWQCNEHRPYICAK